MSAHYRHTQVGWVILGFFAAVGLLVLKSLPPEAAGAARAPLLVVASLVLLLFCALTVEVDAEAIRVRLGIGLVRKRIPLAEAVSWRAVRNPWYSGWGIKLGPRGVLWNVSGFRAVEIDLPDGRRFRIGTDEPEELVRAITQAKGVSAPPPSRSRPCRESWPAPTALPEPAPCAVTSASKGSGTAASTSSGGIRPTC